jgi:uncharacterized membrane protein
MINNLIEKMGFSICHQLPSRSLNIGNLYLPVCSRCSGIYIGFTVSAIILFIMFRKKENNLPPAYIIVISCLFILSTMTNGILSYLTPFSTSNNARFITGFLCGASVAIMLYPIFVFQYYKKSKNIKILSNPVKFVAYLIILMVFIAAVLARISFLDYFFYYLTAFSIIFTFYFVNLVLTFLVPFFSQRAKKLPGKYLVLPSVISISLLAIELFLSYRFHQFLLKF